MPPVNLYLGTDNALYYPTDTDFKVNAFRAYFHLGNGLYCGTPKSEVRAFNLSFGGDATHIISLNAQGEMTHAQGWYTLSGMKLNGKPNTKGIYLHDGRKEVVK